MLELSVLLIAALLACGGGAPPGPVKITSEPFDTGGGAPTQTPDDTGGTGTDTPPTGTDCKNLPPLPMSWDYIVNVPSSDEFAFDSAGLMYNIDTAIGELFATPYHGDPIRVGVYDAVAELGAIRVLPDGDLALADRSLSAIVRLDPETAAASLLLPGVTDPLGMVVGPDAQLYLSSQGQILRFDPAAPAAPELLLELPGAELDGLTFSPDAGRLYFTNDTQLPGTGTVAFASSLDQLGLDRFGEPTQSGTLSPIPTDPYTLLEGAAVDVCGNIYTLQIDGQIRRIRPDGRLEPFVRLTSPEGVYTTALRFGSGIGGWRRDRLYVMNQLGGMFDVFVGIDGSPEPHWPQN